MIWRNVFSDSHLYRKFGLTIEENWIVLDGLHKGRLAKQCVS